MSKHSRLPPLADPLWYKDAIIYQLHVKSFCDSNNDGVGDFRGLMEKLDYVAELGVTAVWLLPFYPSPRRDDGYDISDYRGVHPEYGTLADIRRFIAAAHDRGLRVITELVVNHTSDQHPWFQRARRARPGTVARNFYVWSDDDRQYAGTRIIFLDTEKSNWAWDPVAGSYFWHRFYSHQPDLNFDNPRVLHEVLSVMRFWLDMGADGLRLDAIPYLVEREGTSNENLPETHAILKQMRRALDAYAPGRMLLAEANQWPEDAQQYFADGDECHMSFHFPLMPRMYMAIAREDRFPITDIMRQTPAIPETCQWAVFLRNHDELTLEMVTDSERDMLWEHYASDRRARLNLGIRRRLAPLLEGDRRRIELMNGLLLSMPGTPVIYYGDEIGMGDNIHLGDRDGVRTPMQWSPDRNGGFSRADPARLVLPPIMDPIYGYQAVNVEAQAASPHSLLNWTRRMLAVRKQFRAFGRGGLRFLYPGNRKVLAFLRELPAKGPAEPGETVLCIYNLSRAAQAVELDLAAFAKFVPIDITGGSTFPPIGQHYYLLALPPYGFFWFLLAPEAQLPPWHVPAPEPLPEFATIVLRHEIEEVLAPAARSLLERDALPAYLPKRRWFAAKDEPLQAVAIAYAARLPDGADAVLLAEVAVALRDRTENYVLPLAITWDDAAPSPLAQQLALARVRRGRRLGYLTDGFAVDELARVVLAALGQSRRLASAQGTIEFRATSRMAGLTLPDGAEIRRLSAERSNTSLVVNDAVVVKIIRRLTPGIHPEGEMMRYLTERGYANIAPLYGEVVRVAPDGTPHTLALAEGFVRNQGDGWTWTLDFLARTVEELAVTGEGGQHEADAFASYNAFAATVGRRLGELHAVLAAPSEQPDFAPEEADAATLARWADAAIEQIDRALAVLRAAREWPDAETGELANQLLGQEDELKHAAARLVAGGAGTLAMRAHGDFHLGCALVVPGDAYIGEFGSDSGQSPAARRQKACALRDVAALLRSLDYAAAASGRVAASAQAGERRLLLLQRFRGEASAAFLAAYCEILAAAAWRWVPQSAEVPLLDLFLIEKAASEICYEAEQRPNWFGIPVRGLHAIASRLHAPAESVMA
jgi:maltose alpha-D-glucosyltransferase / alpha-amylase